MKSVRTILAKTAALLLLGTDLAAIPQVQAVGGPATDWMHDAKFGVMQHWLAEGCPMFSCPVDPAPTVSSWNSRVDNYDVAGVVSQLKSIGAGYLVLAVGQNSGYWAANNSVYDELVPPTDSHPSRLSKRDLISDMGTALHKEGLKLIVYVPIDAPCQDDYARTMLDGPKCTNPGVPTSSTYQEKWIRILKKWSQQWGTKVDGWWVDGASNDGSIKSTQPTPYPNLASYYTATAGALRAGNPNALVGLSPGPAKLIPLSDHPVSDFTPGETNPDHWPDPFGVRSRFVDDRGVQLQYHILSQGQTNWGAPPNFGMTWSDEKIVANTLVVTDVGGAVTWDVGYNRTNGHISDAAVAQLKKVGQAVSKLSGSSLVGVGSGRCVDIPQADNSDGRQLQLYECNGSQAQRWTMPGDGTVRAMGKCMDIRQGNQSSGTAVQTYTCNGTPAQQWTYSASTRSLIASGGKCLYASGSSTGNKTPLIIWDCGGGGNAQWGFHS